VANFRKLLAPALVVPLYQSWMNKPWLAQVLGVGSVVDLIKGPMPSPITGKDEIYVLWVDLVGRECKGWLARDTPMNVGGRALSFLGRDDLKTGAWDNLREEIHASKLNARQYIATKVTTQTQLTQLQAVIRELGGRIKNSDDDSIIITRAIRLTTGEDITMEEVQEERASAAAAPAKGKKSKKQRKAAKAAAKSGKKGGKVKTKRQPLIVTVGTALLALGLTGKGKQLAGQLAKGNDLKKGQLVELRDAVNEAGAAAREAGKGGKASQLSSANRLVRRLARR
jgi:hypothetical protein